ncbi:hypothetical protein AWC38_SpisGene3841 [Stylophora pistillata]|uniref:Integrase core domain-containing protein n=1 Tax=Stylophora pistillata TaxID=50429 RepID=A0A2B4SQG1_STYPI|nr:hypothetical protein AWC38_SpisGene3841 [Stylophora pistillata]
MSLQSDFNADEDLSTFLHTVLDKAEQSLHENCSSDSLQTQTVVDQTISLLRTLAENDNDFQDTWSSLASAFYDVFQCLQERNLDLNNRPTSVAQVLVASMYTGRAGRPSFKIPQEMLEDLRGFGFSWQKIADILGVSRWTIYRRVQEYGLKSMSDFSLMSDGELDNIVSEYMNQHGKTTGQSYITGYLRSKGLRVQRSRVRESMARLDPENAALRWGAVVTRRTYLVPWPNSLWHLDGHHSLIRWGLVVHGCIDGFSRRIMFLHCSPNNLSETVLSLFLDAVEKDGLWPSRIRVDRGVENVLVCDAIVDARGAEDSGNLNIEDPTNMFALHFVFLPRLNKALHEYQETFNHHGIRTANSWSPYQMWMNGMLHDDNPLSHGGLDEDPDDLVFYGHYPQGPSPFDDSDNNVTISPIEIHKQDEVLQILQQEIDPLKPSTDMGIDIYIDALDLVNQVLHM